MSWRGGVADGATAELTDFVLGPTATALYHPAQIPGSVLSIRGVTGGA